RYVTKDYGVAVGYFRKAAENNYALAQYNIGLMYYNGWGVTEDRGLALKWFERAAKHHESEYAQYLMGEMYAEGLGIQKDRSQAYAWMRISADHRLENMEQELTKLLWETSPAEDRRALALSKQYNLKYENKHLIENEVN
ncbi:MAG: sel1 repeat family protein, partial [Proteobacteria bacterium]|nr:sel1 repeat family protein [Pseudomonadota bacterium]